MARIKINPNHKTKAIDQVTEICGEKLLNCMQCAKCSASCPASSEMDLLPHQVIRLLQIGNFEKVLSSKSIWNCASCFTCASRCPRDIDASKIMEAVRLTRIRAKGNTVFSADDLPDKMDDQMPQQAVVSAFRKYSK